MFPYVITEEAKKFCIHVMLQLEKFTVNLILISLTYSDFQGWLLIYSNKDIVITI